MDTSSKFTLVRHWHLLQNTGSSDDTSGKFTAGVTTINVILQKDVTTGVDDTTGKLAATL
jgi:hypothetical protein